MATQFKYGVGNNYVNRGTDPSSNDFSVGDFTTDGTWRNLNLSSIIPIGTKLVSIKRVIADDLVSQQIILRTKGQSNYIDIQALYTQVADVNISDNVLIVPDADRIIEYFGSNTTWTTINLVVKGWWI